MTLTVSSTQTVEVQLKPALKTRILRELRAFAELKAQAKVLEAAMAKHKASIRQIREEAGVESLKIEGFTATNVTNTRTDQTRFKMKLIEMGVTADMLEEAKEASLKAGRPYEKITVPGEKGEGDDES